MPSTQVTFFMENEAVSNAYPGDPSDGAAGWFLMDNGSEFSLDTNPRTGESSALGSVFKPRIISDITDSRGTVSVDTIGDMNLDYTDCPVNPPTGNPHCDSRRHGRLHDLLRRRRLPRGAQPRQVAASAFQLVDHRLALAWL
ncbi:MAG: hypothetical protein U5Q44_13400 [Dehalococcoidia bacterium]|nr:hypothetical protein [Dehalococcoidia bacterium]